MASFPTLTRNVSHRGWQQKKLIDPTIRSEFVSGAIATRARFTGTIPDVFNVTYHHISAADKVLLETFQNSIKIGAVTFNWLNILTNTTWKMRLSSQIRFGLEPNCIDKYYAEIDMFGVAGSSSSSSCSSSSSSMSSSLSSSSLSSSSSSSSSLSSSSMSFSSSSSSLSSSSSSNSSLSSSSISSSSSSSSLSPLTIGSEAINRNTDLGGSYTFIDLTNPANDSGIIDTIEVWSSTNITGAKVGTFYLVSGSNYKCRDSESIGNITSGSKQTFSGLSINVQPGDFIGIYWGNNNEGIEADSSGYSGVVRVSGDYADPDDEATYTSLSGYTLSLYGTGST